MLSSLRPVVLLTLWLSCFFANASSPYQFNAVAVTGGGYITGIVAHPTEQGLMYARSDIGSSYRWSQALNKWIPLTDFISGASSNLFGTESLALDPTNSSRLYLAQGRYLTSNESAFFVSEDQGETFSIYPAPFPMGSNELGRNNGERMAVDPFQPSNIWMGTRTEGLWKSTDYAKSWENVTSFPNAFANTIGIVFVIFDPLIEGTMYAGATAPEGLYQSSDHGTTWEKIPGQPNSWNDTNFEYFAGETQPQSTAPQPMKAALSTSGVLYVTYGDYPGPYGTDYGAVYKYDTKEKTWTLITPDAGNTTPAPYTPQAFPAGGFCGVSLDPHNPETVVVVSLDRDPGPAFDSMYVSFNGGNTWKDMSQLSTPAVGKSTGFWGHAIGEAVLNNGTEVPWLNFDWSERWGGYGAPNPVYGLTRFGWWMSAVQLSPWNTGSVIYGTGATVWASDDILSAAEKSEAPNWNVQAQGIEETVCLAMISPTKGPNLYSGFGDINGFRHEDLDVPQPMFGLPVFSNLDSLDWAGQNPDFIVRIGVNGLNNTAETGCHQGAYSNDTGIEWTTFATCVPPINETSDDSGTVAVDASGDYIVWAVASDSLQGTPPTDASSGPYYTKNLGATWESPTGLTVQTPNISADRVQPGTFYSFINETWYMSSDGGASYSTKNAASIGLPDSTPGALPVVDFSKAGHIYLPLSGEGIYYSTNFGDSWQKISSANPALFTVGAAKPGSSVPALFVYGTVPTGSSDFGLYRSDDNGGSWARVDDEGHQYGGLFLIQGDARVYGRVYLGTSGRGIVRADFDDNAAYGVNVAGTGGI